MQMKSGAMQSGRVSGQRQRICVEIYRSSSADSTNKKHVHPELKCDSEEQQDHGCVTKLLNWRFCIVKPNKHFQEKCWKFHAPLSRLFLSPPSSSSSGVPSSSFTDSKVSRQSAQTMFEG